jgi:CRP-like cAMP-binding protein
MSDAVFNHVLRTMDDDTRHAALREADRVTVAVKDIMAREGEATSHVLFPETAVISTLTEYRDGSVIEMANVGREACTGLNLLLGSPAQLTTEEIQVGGEVWRLPAEAFRSLVACDAGFLRAVQAAAQSVVFQVMISGACNGAHSASQRLARWLLTMRDRSGSEELPLTQDFLASMLGLRRSTVTEVAQSFREDDLIHYVRGAVRVIDPAGLEARSCECYRRVKNANERLLPKP